MSDSPRCNLYNFRKDNAKNMPDLDLSTCDNKTIGEQVKTSIMQRKGCDMACGDDEMCHSVCNSVNEKLSQKCSMMGIVDKLPQDALQNLSMCHDEWIGAQFKSIMNCKAQCRNDNPNNTDDYETCVGICNLDPAHLLETCNDKSMLDKVCGDNKDCKIQCFMYNQSPPSPPSPPRPPGLI